MSTDSKDASSSIERNDADVAVLSPSMFMKFSMKLDQFRGDKHKVRKPSDESIQKILSEGRILRKNQARLLFFPRLSLTPN